MPYSIRKNWFTSLDLILSKPIIILPFIIVAFIEGLALELLYFAHIKPFSIVLNPIIRKFFGAGFLHYPGNLLILPSLFYYVQTGIYVFFGVVAMAACVDIFKNIELGHRPKTSAVFRDTFGRYLSFVGYGVIVTALSILIKKASVALFSKIPALGLTLILFFSNIIMYTFLILTIPLIILKGKSLFRALAGSIYLGFRNFLKIFALISVPLLVYLPITLTKSAVPKLVEKTLPEITVYIVVAGIIAAVFVDCFIYVCASQFLVNTKLKP